MLSLAVVDADVEFGTEVTLVWGEEGGGSAKPVVERHVQVELRAIVSPVPVLGGRAHDVRRGLAHGGCRGLDHACGAGVGSSFRLSVASRARTA